ncbi:hypothetical protein evm_007094 [Chilo suppressalis]|nr:hypothetical protein evm_007094 [Chilo suppressalis]
MVTGAITGHTPFIRYLFNLGVKDIPLCRGYMEAEETATHVLLECNGVAEYQAKYLGSPGNLQETVINAKGAVQVLLRAQISWRSAEFVNGWRTFLCLYIMDNKKNRKYSEFDLKTAVENVLSSKMTIYRASKECKIPWSTLKENVMKYKSLRQSNQDDRIVMSKIGRPFALPVEIEQKLTSNIIDAGAWFWSFSPK